MDKRTNKGYQGTVAQDARHPVSGNYGAVRFRARGRGNTRITCDAYIGITQNGVAMYIQKLNFDTLDGVKAFHESLDLRMDKMNFVGRAYIWCDVNYARDYDIIFKQNPGSGNYIVTVYRDRGNNMLNRSDVDAALETCVMPAYETAKKKDVAA